MFCLLMGCLQWIHWSWANLQPFSLALTSSSQSTFKCCGRVPSSLIHSHSASLCEQNTCKLLRVRCSCLSITEVVKGSLQRGHGFFPDRIGSMHVRQNLFPQQSTRQGSLRIHRQMEHSVWRCLGGSSTKMHSYPPWSWSWRFFGWSWDWPWSSTAFSSTQWVLLDGAEAMVYQISFV